MLPAEAQATLVGGALYLYREAALEGDQGLSSITLLPGTAVTLLSVQGDTAQVQLLSRRGTLPLDCLAVDKDMYYVLGLPGDSNLAMERRLEELGYLDSRPDEIFDFDTAQAVVRLRARAGLPEEFALDERFTDILYSPQAPQSQILTVPIFIGDDTSYAARLQNRLAHLEYYDAPLTHRFDSLTCQALMLFQQMEGFDQTGKADRRTLQRLFSPQAGKMPRNLMAASPDTEKFLPGGVVLADWWQEGGIETRFARESVALVTDLASGLSWQVMRRGGTNHADVQPVTAEDTRIMAQALGGEWSWQRRPIWVTVEGVRYAASMNCMPHGGGAIQDNDFPGHFCIHFLNSRTHGGNNLDELHQRCVNLAAGLDYTDYQAVNWEEFFAQDPNTPKPDQPQ